MASLAELQDALQNAHKAGDTDAARILANEIIKARRPAVTDNLNAETLDPSKGGLTFRPFGIDTGIKMPEMLSQGLAGAGKSFADTGRGLGQLVGKVDAKEIDESKARDKWLMNTGAGMAGNVVGDIAQTALIPGGSTYKGAAAIGAGLGAIKPVGSDESRFSNMAIGGAGGIAGQGIANVVGRAVRPVQSTLGPAEARLAAVAEQQGIPLNIAQKTGSRPLQIINSVLDNLPFTADRQAADKAAQRAAFNRAVLKQAGESADAATPDVLGAAKNRIGGQFNALSARNDVALGDDFLNALAKIDAGRNAFTKPAVLDAVDKGLSLAAQGKISGRDYQNIRSTLGKQAQDAFNSGNSEVGQALKTIQSALDDAATNSISAADKTAWGQARKQWAALKAIEKAAAPTSADAVAGNISPAKLASAVMKGDKNAMLFGTGDQTLPDLARIGQSFIKEQIPNSGTAQRSFYQGLLTGGGGGLGMLVSPVTAIGGLAAGSVAPAAMQSLMRSPAGQTYLSRGLLADGPITQGIGLAGRKALAGGVPAGLLLQAE